MEMSRAVCVYCGARPGRTPSHLAAARALGAGLAARGWTLIYGGGSIGMMGMLARSMLESGGYVVGIIPQALQQREVSMVDASELIVTETLRQRKQLMDDRADVFLALPGGFGTFEELLEVLTLRQLRYHNKPIIVLNIDGYYDPLIRLFEHALEQEFIAAYQMHLYEVATSVDEALAMIEEQTGTTA
jgi:hypothetical protein